MNITKCDICKKVIKGESLMAGRGFFSGEKVEMCEKCGAPVLKFLKKHKILKVKK